MAHKQVNELVALDEVTGDDLIPIYDTTFSGSEKLKKYTVQELKSDLTSMDPSSFGNWVLAKEVTGTIADINTFSISSDLRDETEIMLKWSIESVASNAHIYLQVGDGSTWDTSTENYSATHSWSQDRMLIENLDGEADITAIWNPRTKTLRVIGSFYESSVSNLDFTIKYKGSLDAKACYIFPYNGGSISSTGNYRLYKWQEVKPIELHSYELVAEYNLNNEILDDTIDWDGEADPDIRIVSKLDLGRADLVINGTTGTTDYDYGQLYSDGTTVYQTAAENYDKGNIGLADRYVITEGNLSQDGGVKLICSLNSMPSVWGRSDIAWNNTDPVTSIRMMSNAAAATGNIRIYKLAKAHLFNQTIYNNTTLNVSTAGSDTTGDGSTSKPFASIQGALDWLKNKTINNDVYVTIQLADGTYNNLDTITHSYSSSNIQIVGNETTPSNVTLNFNEAQYGITVKDFTRLTVKGVKLYGYAPADWTAGFYAQLGGSLYLKNVIVENFGVGAQASQDGYVQSQSNNTFNNCNYAVSATRLGNFFIASGTTLSNCIYGISSYQGGRVHYVNATFTGNSSNTYTDSGGTITNG